MKTKLFIFLFAAAFTVRSQNTFQKTYGGSADATCVQQTTDGGFIIGGTVYDSVYSGDFFLMKTNSNGSVQWSKTYDNTHDEREQSVLQTSDGGFITVGYTSHYDSIGFYIDAYVLKTDSAGTMQWAKTYGGTNEDKANAIQATADGGFIIAGTTQSFGLGAQNGYNAFYVIKIDFNGNISWTKTYDTGTWGEEATCVKQTSDGGYIVAGNVSAGIRLVKTTSFGGIVWAKAYGGSESYTCNAVEQTSAGDYVVAGKYQNNSGFGDDIFLGKIRSDGIYLWGKAYDGGSYSEAATSLIKLSSGSFILCSKNDTSVSLIKATPSGSISWAKNIGKNDYYNGCVATPTADGGFALAGGISGKGSFLIKTNSNGSSGCYEQSVFLNLLSPFFVYLGVPNPQFMNGGDTAVVSVQENNISTSEVVLCENGTGIYESGEHDSFALFPNPAAHTFTLKSEKEIYEIEIVNALGEKVYEEALIPKGTKAITVTLPSGMGQGIYFLQLKTEQGTTTKKLIIQK